jgi:hypothetical protein
VVVVVPAPVAVSVDVVVDDPDRNVVVVLSNGVDVVVPLPNSELLVVELGTDVELVDDVDVELVDDVDGGTVVGGTVVVVVAIGRTTDWPPWVLITDPPGPAVYVTGELDLVYSLLSATPRPAKTTSITAVERRSGSRRCMGWRSRVSSCPAFISSTPRRREFGCWPRAMRSRCAAAAHG